MDRRKNIAPAGKDAIPWSPVTCFAGAAVIALMIGSVTHEMIAVVASIILVVYFIYKTYLAKVQQVCSLAYYDSLTGLPNRILFKEHLNNALASAANGKIVAIMFLDLDNFKRINDSYGHNVGDLLLKSVARRLTATLRGKSREAGANEGDPNVIISRFGGDEFTILLKRIGNPDQVAQVAQRILTAFANPFSLEGHEVSAALSIGITLCPLDGVKPEDLLKNADAAMFQVKEGGRNSYQFYSQSINEAFSVKLQIEKELRSALARGEFRIFYQPKVQGTTGLIVGAEALIRWQHPSRGLLSAAEFISVAEDTGLIRPIGEWVLRAACLQLAGWQKSSVPIVPVAVNLSNAQFRQHDLPKIISDILHDTGLDSHFLELEITESMIMQNGGQAVAALRQLHALGCRISIDDFGTGYSSLGRLKRFSVDALKVDQSFVTDLAASSDDMAITKAIIAMAHSLGLKVIAEGVENQQQYQILKTQGCDEIQGFLFGRPMPGDEFALLLTRVLKDQLFELHERKARWADRNLRLIHSQPNLAPDAPADDEDHKAAHLQPK